MVWKLLVQTLSGGQDQVAVSLISGMKPDSPTAEDRKLLMVQIRHVLSGKGPCPSRAITTTENRRYRENRSNIFL